VLAPRFVSGAAGCLTHLRKGGVLRIQDDGTAVQELTNLGEPIQGVLPVAANCHSEGILVEDVVIREERVQVIAPYFDHAEAFFEAVQLHECGRQERRSVGCCFFFSGHFKPPFSSPTHQRPQAGRE
jgi:hypothetical protein